ncbi:MAG TPA: hypothetical protein VGI40_27475 [Pirellulaceae bacterium]
MGHWNSYGVEQAFRQVFVTRNVLRDRTGGIRFRRPNPALAFALAEHHQVAFRKPAARYSSLSSCLHDRACARSQAHIIRQIDQTSECLRKIEVLDLTRRRPNSNRIFQASARQRFHLNFNRKLENIRQICLPGLSVLSMHTSRQLTKLRQILDDLSLSAARLEKLLKATKNLRIGDPLVRRQRRAALGMFREFG